MLCIGRLDDGRQTIPPPWPLKPWLERSFAMLDCLEFTHLGTMIPQMSQDITAHGRMLVSLTKR